MASQEQRVSYWLEMADYDLATAEAMLRTERYLYVGFMCHQAIEKLLKAYWVRHLESTPPFTHSLSLLASRASLYDELNEKQKDLIDVLEPMNIEARYPTDKERTLQSLTQPRCAQLIRETREVSQWIRERL